MTSDDFEILWAELAPQFERFHSRTEIADYRSDWDEIFTVTDGALQAHCEEVDAGGVPAQWVCHESVDDNARVIMYLHGGGFTLGSIDSHRDLMVRLSRTAHARVLGVDYRLAPEHAFPAANDDTEMVWRWLLAQGCDAGRLAIAGDSAGGGLVLTTALRLRDLGLPLPAGLVMFSPWVDLMQSGTSMQTRAAVDRMVTAEILDQMAMAYLQGQPLDAADSRACPLQADFAGLPPMLVQVGEDEVLYDDAARVVNRARRAGIDAELVAFAGMCHVFQIFAYRLPQAAEAMQQAGRFIAERCE